jgi:hypothetical protein
VYLRCRLSRHDDWRSATEEYDLAKCRLARSDLEYVDLRREPWRNYRRRTANVDDMYCRPRADYLRLNDVNLRSERRRNDCRDQRRSQVYRKVRLSSTE